MRIVSFFLIILLITAFGFYMESPHGKSFTTTCSECHTTEGWTVDLKNISFNHAKTRMPLKGQHTETNCKECHTTLVFNEVKTECFECHTDVHQATVGNECNRCHAFDSWVINNLQQMHQQSRFPLLGVHHGLDCFECHKTETYLRFEVLGTSCYNCHTTEYASATEPNHIEKAYSTQCEECHNVFSREWKGTGFNHGFFPLSRAHEIADCKTCHKIENQKLSSDCISCHLEDYNKTTDPNHVSSNFQFDCSFCHTTDPGWETKSSLSHDYKYFPIYVGIHGGKWNNCVDCHNNKNDYKQTSCLDCHEHNQTDMDEEHQGKRGYSYLSSACLNCHPNGRK